MNRECQAVQSIDVRKWHMVPVLYYEVSRLHTNADRTSLAEAFSKWMHHAWVHHVHRMWACDTKQFKFKPNFGMNLCQHVEYKTDVWAGILYIIITSINPSVIQLNKRQTDIRRDICSIPSLYHVFLPTNSWASLAKYLKSDGLEMHHFK